MYQYIVDIETMLLMRYKVAPAQFFQDMTVFDLQIFMQNLQQEVEKDDKERNRGNKLMKSLAAIRDILNFMFLPDNPR